MNGLVRVVIADCLVLHAFMRDVGLLSSVSANHLFEIGTIVPRGSRPDTAQTPLTKTKNKSNCLRRRGLPTIQNTMADAAPQFSHAKSIKENLRDLSLMSSPPKANETQTTSTSPTTATPDASNLLLVQQLFQSRGASSLPSATRAPTQKSPPSAATTTPPPPARASNPPNPEQQLQQEPHDQEDNDKDDDNPLKRKSEDEMDDSCCSESSSDDESDLDDDELAMIQTLMKGIEDVKAANRNMKLRLLAHHQQQKKARVDNKAN